MKFGSALTIAFASVGIALSATGQTQYIETPPKLIAPAYLGTNSVSYGLTSGPVTISNIRFTTLNGRVPYPPGGAPPLLHAHDFMLNFDVTANSITVPGVANGHMQASTVGGIGTYLTEISSFDATGTSPFGSFLIRQSGPSDGLSQVEDHGSFFRVTGILSVATSISLDGGSTWTPADRQIQLNAVPEPATAIGFALAAVALLKRRSRR